MALRSLDKSLGSCATVTTAPVDELVKDWLLKKETLPTARWYNLLLLLLNDTVQHFPLEHHAQGVHTTACG